MKRTFSLLLAVILSVLCLVSCGESENAYDLYNKAIKAAENGMEATITMTINVQGQKIETKMDIKASKEAYEIAMNVEGMDVVAIYTDGVMYMDMDMGVLGTQKIKQEISLEEFLAQTESGSADMIDLDKETLKDIKLETKDGKKSFTVDLNGEEYAELLSSYAGELGEGAEFGDLVISCLFHDNGTMAAYNMKASITVAGQTMDMEAKIEFTSIGKAPAIQAPADADSYQDAGGILG
jgi:outer membrane lipoprotein-sorting protein